MLKLQSPRHRSVSRAAFLASALAASCVMALTTGCASGGFKLTRQYASFVNSQTLIIRILIYIFTGIVFAVTMLIDLVVNNTIDFWSGKVSAGSYDFKKGDKTYVAKHEFLPGTDLKRSTIEIRDQHSHLLQTVRLQETPAHEIEVFVDNVLRTRVSNIRNAPVATIFDRKGLVVQNDVSILNPNIALSY